MEYKFNDNRGEMGCEFEGGEKDTNGVKESRSFWVSLEMADALKDFEKLIAKIKNYIEEN